jgi:hypothetical protein
MRSLEVRLPDGVEADVDLSGAPDVLGPGAHLIRVPAPGRSMTTTRP